MLSARRCVHYYEEALFHIVRKHVMGVAKPAFYPLEDWYLEPLPDKIRCPLCRVKIHIPRNRSMWAWQWYEEVQEHIQWHHRSNGYKLLQQLNTGLVPTSYRKPLNCSTPKGQGVRDKLFVDLWNGKKVAAGEGYTCPVGSCRERFAYMSHALRHLQYEHKPSEIGNHAGLSSTLNALKGPASRPKAKAKPQTPAAVLRQKQKDAAKALYSHAKSGDVMAVAAVLGNAAVSVNPNAGGEDGFTPLITAAEAGHAGVVALLVGDARTHVNLKNSYGQTALSFAAQNGHEDVTAALLQSPRLNPGGVCVNRTALMTAAECNRAGVARLLVQDPRCAGTVGVMDDTGLTALALAARNGHEAVVDEFLQCDPPVDLAAECFKGLTATQHAARHGHKTLAKKLQALAVMQERAQAQPQPQPQQQARGHGHAAIDTVARDAASASSVAAGGNRSGSAKHTQRCLECDQRKQAGMVDELDGHWYCTDCWSMFQGGHGCQGGVTTTTAFTPPAPTPLTATMLQHRINTTTLNTHTAAHTTLHQHAAGVRLNEILKAEVPLGLLKTRLADCQKQLAQLAQAGPGQGKNQRKRLKKQIAALKTRILDGH